MQDRQPNELHDSRKSDKRTFEQENDRQDPNFEASPSIRMKRSCDEQVPQSGLKRRRSCVLDSLNISSSNSPSISPLGEENLENINSLIDSAVAVNTSGSSSAKTASEPDIVQRSPETKENSRVLESVQLNIFILSLDKTIFPQFPLSSTVFELKEAISLVAGISPSQQRLIMSSKVFLDDSKVLQDYSIMSGQKIWLIKTQNTNHFNIPIGNLCSLKTNSTVLEMFVNELKEFSKDLVTPLSSTCSFFGQKTIESLCSQLSRHTVVENNCFYCGNRIKLNLFFCKLCKNDFCLKHRHPEIHCCCKLSSTLLKNL